MIKKHNDLFLERVYTPWELDYCQGRRSCIQHYAGRWAAKEAILKSMGTGWAKGIQWTDIEIINEMGGKPSVHLHNAARQWCDKLGISDILISISHCNSFATAFATAISIETK